METGHIPQKGLPSRVQEYIKHTYVHTDTHRHTRLRPVRRGKGGKIRAYVEDQSALKLVHGVCLCTHTLVGLAGVEVYRCSPKILGCSASVLRVLESYILSIGPHLVA